MDPDGVIYRYREIYGWGGKENLGSREYATEVAKRINQIEKGEIEDGAVFRLNPADSQIWAADGHEQSIYDSFAKEGVLWTPSKKGPGSRINGWDVCRQRLATKTFKVTSDCTHFLRTVPGLMSDDKDWEDIDTEQEDHAADEWRYSMISRHRPTGPDKSKDIINPLSFAHLTRKPGR